MNYTVRWNFVLFTFQSWRPPVNRKSGWLCRWKEGLHAFFQPSKCSGCHNHYKRYLIVLIWMSRGKLWRLKRPIDLAVRGGVLTCKRRWMCCDMFVRSSLCAQSCTFWWMGGKKKKKKKKNPTDRPSLKKAVEGNQTIFFFGLVHSDCYLEFKICYFNPCLTGGGGGVVTTLKKVT